MGFVPERKNQQKKEALQCTKFPTLHFKFHGGIGGGGKESMNFDGETKFAETMRVPLFNLMVPDAKAIEQPLKGQCTEFHTLIADPDIC